MVETRSAAKPMGRRLAGKWGGGKFAPKRKVCPFCASRAKEVDYKDTALLNRFISDRGKIEPRRRTGTCNRHQHAVALAIKQARHVALLPFVPGHIHLQGVVPPMNLNPVVPFESNVTEVKPEVVAPAVAVEENTAEVTTEETAIETSAEDNVAVTSAEESAPEASETEAQEIVE